MKKQFFSRVYAVRDCVKPIRFVQFSQIKKDFQVYQSIVDLFPSHVKEPFHCVRSIRLEHQNKYFLVWTLSLVNNSILHAYNTQLMFIHVPWLDKLPVCVFYLT